MELLLQIVLVEAPPLETYEADDLQLGLAGDHQRINASLAVALCRSWAKKRGSEDHIAMVESVSSTSLCLKAVGNICPRIGCEWWAILRDGNDEFKSLPLIMKKICIYVSQKKMPVVSPQARGLFCSFFWFCWSQAFEKGDLPEVYKVGLSITRFPGRAQVVREPVEVPDNCSDAVLRQRCDSVTSRSLAFFLDGAHTPESMEICAKWFCRALKEDLQIVTGLASGNGNGNGNGYLNGASNRSSFRRVI